MRTMKMLLAATGALLLLVMLPVSPAGASVYEGTVDFTCTNADAAGSGAHILDRDNTGTGQEALNVTVVDGVGNTIYELDFSNTLGTFAGGIGDFFYTTPPEANPITFTLTSLAGNGLPEQIDYVQVGICDGLPYAAPTVDAPSEADPGETITVTGTGCAEGPVTVRLLENAGDTTALATASGLADSAGAFAIDLTIPANTPPGDRTLEVWCGDESEPLSDVAVLDLLIRGQATTTTAAPTTVAPATTAPAATPVARPAAAVPRFTG